MTMTTDMIQNALNKDYNRANEIFGEIMTQRVNDALDQEKIKLADQIYNGAEEEQLELDLEDEDVGGEEADDNSAQPDEESETETLQEPDSDVELEVGDEDPEDDES